MFKFNKMTTMLYLRKKIAYSKKYTLKYLETKAHYIYISISKASEKVLYEYAC